MVSGLVVAGESAGHDDDHGPLDHRGVMLWQPFVIADGAPASVDPGERALDRPPAVRDHEGGLPGEFRDDLDGETQLGGGPVDELAGVAGIGPDQTDARAPSRSCTPALVTGTASSSPQVSTAMWRLRPLIFLPAS
nr:hypothetical protein [Actinoplanes sp. NBRC 103695]